jgi:hypothetical protein
MTGTNMTAREMVQHGMEQVVDGILQLLIKQGPMRPTPVADATGLRQLVPGATYCIMDAMANRGLLARGPALRQTYSVTARGRARVRA